MNHLDESRIWWKGPDNHPDPIVTVGDLVPRQNSPATPAQSEEKPLKTTPTKTSSPPMDENHAAQDTMAGR